MLAYMIRCIRKGVVNAGKPSRDFYRDYDPRGFWSNIIFMGVVATAALLLGILGIIRAWIHG